MAQSAWITTDRLRPHQSTRRELERGLLIVTLAISAGIHGALIREHFVEGVGPGGGFLAATMLLLGLAATLIADAGKPALIAAAAVLMSLITAYAFVITTGVPLLHPGVEPVDGLALFTKGVEALGLIAALLLHHNERTTT